MTTEEAIGNIKAILDEATENYDDECDSSVCYITSNGAKSLEIAIELLKKHIPILKELLILRQEVSNLRKKLASLEEEKVKFRWHDLTVSEDDLPECEEITEYLVYDGTYYYVWEWMPHKKCWTDDGLLYEPDRVVRWQEIDRSHERKGVKEE